MRVVVRINSFEQLYDQSWAGAKTVLEHIKEANKEEELMTYLDYVFEERVDEIELNDYIWFECVDIYEALEMNEVDEDI